MRFRRRDGREIPEDLVTALIAEVYLAKLPGATILYDIRSSRSVRETITRLGGQAVRSRVGHAFIKAGMRERDAIFAGEGSRDTSISKMRDSPITRCLR